MRLDDYVFEEIAIALGASLGESDQEEPGKRKLPRYLVNCEVKIKPHGVVRAVERRVNLVNISASGVGFLDRLMVSSGDQFVVHLPRPGGATLDVLCIARQCRLAANGTFRVGGEFTGEMGPDQRLVAGAQGVVAAQAAALNHQTSSNLRIPAIIRTTIGGTRDIKVMVTERTKEGFTILAGYALSAGDKIILRVHAPGYLPQAWWCRITHVRLIAAGQYRVHAQSLGLVETPKPSNNGLTGWVKRIMGNR